MGRSQYLVVRTYSKESERIYTRYLGVMVHSYGLLLVFFANRHSFLYGRNEPLVRYCFLWLLYGRGRRFVQYCFLWWSCADAGCHVYVPWVYHLAAKQGCTNVRVWLPKLGGLNIFCAHVLRGYLWASPIFFFVDVGNRTNVTSLIGFFCTRTYTREIWRAPRAKF